MALDNIQLWFAKDIKSNEIVISVDASLSSNYECPICGSKVVPKGTKDNAKVMPHFAHIDRSKCTSESMMHWWFKNKFIEVGDTFTIRCGKLNDESILCKSIDIEKSYTTSFGTYRPDVTITSECGKTILFEFRNKSKKKYEDYLDKWLELGHIVVEVDISTLYSDKKIFNALYYEGKSFPKTRDSKKIDNYITLKNLSTDREEDVARIKSLSWLYVDFSKYKLGLISSEDMLCSIEGLDEKDINFVEDFFNNKSCLDLKDKYSKDIICMINDIFSNEISTIKGTDQHFEITSYYDTWSKNNMINIDYEYRSYHEKMLSNNLIERIRSRVMFMTAKSNKYIQIGISKLNTEYGSIDENYNVYSMFTNDSLVCLSYKNNIINRFKMENSDIISSHNSDDVYGYLKSNLSIENYIENKIVNLNKLCSIVEKLNNDYLKSYVKYSDRIYRLSLDLDTTNISKADINIYIENHMGYKTLLHTLLYDNNKFNGINYNNSNLYKLKYALSKIINKHIRNKTDRVWGGLPYETR